MLNYELLNSEYIIECKVWHSHCVPVKNTNGTICNNSFAMLKMAFWRGQNWRYSITQKYGPDDLSTVEK